MAQENTPQLRAIGAYGLPGVRALSVGLELLEDLSQDQCKHILEKLGREETGWRWRVADTLLYSDRKWGETYQEASKLLGRDVGTLMNWVSVAKAFQISRRHETLTFSHHAVVQSLEPERADELLAKAVSDKWSVSSLSEAVRTINVIKIEEQGEQGEQGKRGHGWERVNRPITYKIVVEEREDNRDKDMLVYNAPERNSTRSEDEEQGVGGTSRLTSQQPSTPTTIPLLVTIDPVDTSIEHIKGLLTLFNSGRFPADDKLVEEKARTLYRELAKLYAVESSSSLSA